MASLVSGAVSILSDQSAHQASQGKPSSLHRTRRALIGSVLAVVNYILFYIIGIMLARRLGGEAFGDYSVAIAAASMAATVATLGLEKYALRSVASYCASRDLARLHGFLRYSLMVIVIISVLVAAVILLGYEFFFQSSDSQQRHAFVLALLALPVITVVLHLVEVVTAGGGYLRASLVYRVLLPASALTMIIVWMNLDKGFVVHDAVLAYIMAWGLCLVVSGLMTVTLLPGNWLRTAGTYEGKMWVSQAMAFMASSVVMTVLNQSGVVIVEIVCPNEQAVGLFGAAVQTGSFVVLIATSTNRFYAPQLSVMLDRNDAPGIRRLLRRRMIMVGSIGGGFVALIMLFGEHLLGLYNASFEAGYWTLVVVAVSATFSTLFSIAPYYLQFVGRRRWVVITSSICAVVAIIMTAVLSYFFDALGAAVGYAVPVMVTFWLMHLASRRELKRMEQTASPGQAIE